MERSILEQHLAQAFERVSEGERHIVTQRNRVKLLKKDSRDSAIARKRLAEIETKQAMHVAYRDHLWKG
jgi:antitoxin (DNA-binding transcriptional repressor) of toxin-antitoxin stability system